MLNRMQFELLPNELLLDVFEYLAMLHMFQTFYDLNYRFNTLILDYCRRCRLDFRSISKRDFDTICKTYLPYFATHIISLRLSDDNQTPQQIGLFLSYGFRLNQFTHLQSIDLSHLHSSFILDKLITECSHLASLTHLRLTNCHISINRNNANCLYNKIWNLSKLIHCYIDINFANRNYFPMPTIISTSLRYLFIPNISCYLNELIHLFQSTPNLQYLSIRFIEYIENFQFLLPVLSITHLKLSFDSSLNILEYLLRNTPDLYHLTLQTCNIYINGYQWEEIIQKYLPKLKIFHFKMRFSPLNNEDKDIQLNEILDSFRTKFWIVDHQWFVRCHWYSSDEQYHLDFIDLFSLPYVFKDFLSFTGCKIVKSTCSNDDEYWSYDRVNNLYYGSSHFINSVMSRLRFSKIECLSLSLPCNNQFLLVVCKFDRLLSLCISVNSKKQTNDIQSQLQMLLDQAPRLYSLSFGLCSLPSLSMPLVGNTSKSIRRLNFQGYACGRNWRYFDVEQCDELSCSLLGKQCEILLIKVKYRKSILDLINNMTNLRALNVRCENDTWMNESNTLTSTQDELVEWLRHCLPSSCMITRDKYHPSDIQLWIR